MATNPVDVLVVGAGPVGLFCANELIRHGLSCYIIDKKETISDKSKALGLHIRTLDLFDDCGFLPEILAQGLKIEGAIFKAEDNILIDATFANLAANHHFLIDLPQTKTEQILYQALQQKGLTVQWNTELTEIEQQANQVIATVTTPDKSQQRITTKWLIACDGPHSKVRECLNAKFIGTRYHQTWWLADVHIAESLPKNKLLIYISKKGPLACFPLANNRYRLVMTASEKISHQNPSLEAIRHAFKERSGKSVLLSDPVWLSSFGIEERQIQKYRYERVFFAGDAAHVHSPLGGQGLNTGLQDIYNLVWKLALVQKGAGQEILLDSYHSERYPIAKKVLTKTGLMTHLIMLTNPLLIGLRNVLLRQVLSIKVIRHAVLSDLAELNISYAKSPIVTTLGKKTAFKTGEFLLDFSLTDAQTHEEKQLHQITRGTIHHLFLFAGLAQTQLATLLEARLLLEQRYHVLMKTHLVLINPDSKILPECSAWIDIEQTIHRRFAIRQSMALLIRPDKYLGLTQSPFNVSELLQHLEKKYIPFISLDKETCKGLLL